MTGNYAAPSVSDLTDAIATSQITGWDLLAAVAIVVLAYTVGR